MDETVLEKRRVLTLANGVTLELREAGGVFAGIGRVCCSGVELRNPDEPMYFVIRTPSGVEFTNFRLEEVRPEGGGFRLEFGMERRETDLMEWMTHAVRPRRNLNPDRARPAPAADTRLILELKPVEREFGGCRAAGFSYRYRFRSDSDAIYKLTDCSSWEPGGRASGNMFLMRSCFVPSITRFREPSDFYSSEWYLPECENTRAFQFLPLQTELQGFTFTTGPAGTVVTWANRVGHIRSLFEKERHSEAIRHRHELCGDLSRRFDTPELEVLHFPDALEPYEVCNRYEAVKEVVHETLHAELDFRRERVSAYGMIEEWGNPDMERYARAGVPKLAAAGVKKIGLANHFQNNMNVWGVSNMCCTVDYRIAESVGEDKFKLLCSEARRRGVKVEMWGNTALSTLTWLFRQRSGREGGIRFLPEEDSIMAALEQAKEPFVRTPSNALEADHYAPVFAVLNLRDPAVRAYWLKRWGYAAKELGLRGIFLDSSFNLSSDKFHWCQNPEAGRAGATADETGLLGRFRPEREPEGRIQSEYFAHLTLMREMQRLGYDYCTEDLGVFGIHRHGPAAAARIDSLPLWSECLCSFDADGIAAAGYDPDEIFFRGLAFRMMWILYWDMEFDCLSFRISGNRGTQARPPQEYHLKLLRAFNEAETAMRGSRELLSGDRGVLYRQGKECILWCFREFRAGLPGGVRIAELAGGARREGDRLDCSARSVLRLTAEQPGELAAALRHSGAAQPGLS